MAERMRGFRISDAQMFLISFAIGLIVGIVIFRMKNELIYPSMCLYQELRIDKLKRSGIISFSLIQYVSFERFKEFGLLFLTQITLFRRIVACGYCVACGVACAMLEAFYVQEYALFGMLVFMLTLLPHYIFYVFAWYRLCTANLPIKQLSKTSVVDIAKMFMATMLIVLTGAICESIFNVWLLKIFL